MAHYYNINGFKYEKFAEQLDHATTHQDITLPERLRKPMNQEEFDHEFHYQRPKQKAKLARKFRRYYLPCLSFSNCFNTFIGFVPILRWLPVYKWREDFVNDLVGGLTVGIMQMPQGFAYALLAGVDPVVGLYTSFFPPLFYMLFGTSNHNSVGPFSVVSLMTGKVVEEFLKTPEFGQVSPLILSSALTLCVGLIQILMGLLRLEIITTYFSDQVVAGFTTGASFHVFISQLDDVFGLKKLPKRVGAGYLLRKTYDILTNLQNTNLTTLYMSLGSLVFLVVGKEFISPLLKRRYGFSAPIPYELVLVIIGTAIVEMFRMDSKVEIVNNVPTGMPSPSLPSIWLLPELLPSALGIACVVVAVHISLAKVFAKKFSYRIDAGQELFALGFSSSLSSLFPVYPISCSLSSTMVKVEAGSRTQLANIASSLLLGLIIVYVGQWLRTLPMCILSVIIIYALKNVFKKFADLKLLWRLSKIDFNSNKTIDFWSIWVVSFVATVGWNVMEGLVVAITFALLTVVFRTQWPHWHFLANLSGTTDFKDINRYSRVTIYPGICVFRFDSPLLFTNVELFKDSVHKAMAKWTQWPHTVRVSRSKTMPIFSTGRKIEKTFSTKSLDIDDAIDSVENEKVADEPSNYYRHFIVDCSGFTFVDWMGVNALKEVYSEMRDKHVLVYFASAKAPVRDLFEKSGFYSFVPKQNFYPTITDAVLIARKRRNFSSLNLLEEHAERYDVIDEVISVQPAN